MELRNFVLAVRKKMRTNLNRREEEEGNRNNRRRTETQNEKGNGRD